MEKEILRCSVINCNKKVKEGDYKEISGKIYCMECATLYYKMILQDLGYDPI